MSIFIQQIGNPPNESSVVTGSSLSLTNSRVWINWFNQVNQAINLTEYYGNPSVTINPDFNFVSGVPTPRTQAAGNGVTVAEKWLLRGATGNTYSIGWSPVLATSGATSGSNNAINVVVTSQTAPIIIYQIQPGSAYLRQYQGRPLSISSAIQLLTGEAICRFNYVEFFDPSSRICTGKTFRITSGRNEYSGVVDIPFLAGSSIGAAPYASIEFEIVSSSASFSFVLEYIKAELAEQPTVLYVDHALEQTRIANSP